MQHWTGLDPSPRWRLKLLHEKSTPIHPSPPKYFSLPPESLQGIAEKALPWIRRRNSSKMLTLLYISQVKLNILHQLAQNQNLSLSSFKHPN
ncbi:unnamed protein product [Diplocarpon coronariae]